MTRTVLTHKQAKTSSVSWTWHEIPAKRSFWWYLTFWVLAIWITLIAFGLHQPILALLILIISIALALNGSQRTAQNWRQQSYRLSQTQLTIGRRQVDLTNYRGYTIEDPEGDDPAAYAILIPVKRLRLPVEFALPTEDKAFEKATQLLATHFDYEDLAGWRRIMRGCANILRTLHLV